MLVTRVDRPCQLLSSFEEPRHQAGKRVCHPMPWEGAAARGDHPPLLAFKRQTEIKKVTGKEKLRFFLLKPSDRLCWPPRRAELSPKYPDSLVTYIQWWVPWRSCHPNTRFSIRYYCRYRCTRFFSTFFVDFSLQVTLAQLPSAYNWLA